MVLQFKRSKKLDHALKLMRESQREHHASDSSAVSGASMSDDDDEEEEEEDDDDTIGEEIEQSSSRQERQVTPRDPEGSEGRQVFQLQKLPITEPKQGLAATTSINMRKQPPLYEDNKRIDINARPRGINQDDKHVDINAKLGTNHGGSKHIDIKARLGNDRANGHINIEANRPKMFGDMGPDDLKKFDDYQRELLGAIQAFEARRGSRLEQLGYESGYGGSSDYSEQSDSSSEPGERVLPNKPPTLSTKPTSILKKPPPAPVEDRNDAPVVNRSPNPPPPKQYTSPPVFRNFHLPTPKGMFPAQLPAPRPVQERPTVKSEQPQKKHQDVVAKDQLQSDILIEQLLKALATRELPNLMATQKASTVNRKDAGIPDREKRTYPSANKEAIVSHITDVANHFLKSKQLLESSTNNMELDLNKRMLRENTTELLRNLARIRSHTANGPTSGKTIPKSKPAESKLTEHPDDRLAPDSAIPLLRAKRDLAELLVERETKRLSNKLQNLTETPNARGFNGGRSKEEHLRPNPKPEQVFSLRKLPSRSTEAPDQVDDSADRQIDRVDRLDRVKSMIEELRILRAVNGS